MRLLFGGVLIAHGTQKILDFHTLTTVFPDPLHIGHESSLSLAIFAEFFCSIAIIFGFLYRLSMIPILINMAVIVLVVQARSPFATKELAFIYFCSFILLYIYGPGKYAIDRIFVNKLGKKKQ